MKPESVSVTTTQGIGVGDTVQIPCLDHRWWKRLLYWATGRGRPYIHKTYTVVSVKSGPVDIAPIASASEQA